MASTAKIATQEQIETLVAASRPERLSDPGKRPITGDHAANVVQLTAWGQTALAADHLLFPELNGCLPGIVAGVIRQLNIRFVGAGLHAGDSPAEVARKIRDRQYAYETLLEMAINFCGLESRWLDAAERCQAVGSIRGALAEWEAREAAEGQGSVAVAVVRRFLDRMKLVQKGISMAAKTALRIEQALDFGKPILLAVPGQGPRRDRGEHLHPDGAGRPLPLRERLRAGPPLAASPGVRAGVHQPGPGGPGLFRRSVARAGLPERGEVSPEVRRLEGRAGEVRRRDRALCDAAGPVGQPARLPADLLQPGRHLRRRRGLLPVEPEHRPPGAGERPGRLRRLRRGDRGSAPSTTTTSWRAIRPRASGPDPTW